MYHHTTLKNNDPFAQNLIFNEKLDNIDKIEVWCSSFNDVGNDFCEYRFFEQNKETPIFVKRIEGY